MAKKIGITLGDPGGIGPEIVLKTLRHLQSSQTTTITPIIFGSESVLNHPKLKILRDQLNSSSTLIDCYSYQQEIAIGHPNAENGKAAKQYILSAISAIQKGEIDAIVTAPISKKSFELAGSPYKDHTTLFANQTKSTQVSMGFYTKTLKTILTTIHMPLKEVPTALTKERLETALINSLKFCGLLNIKAPKIALAALNPHAGEEGLFGDEDEKILRPFVETMRKKGYPIEGPFSADSLYWRAHQGEFDMVISLYHDQGLIPVKLLGFGEAVNVTLGLPFIRTSPDHGTAFDIAYQNKAKPSALIHSIELATRLLTDNE
ncbi:4-hydroxythreonine-4-phosphate dehydrogenase PdxA [Candidatus Marinamargulisbacteria bacterium SCGC AG-439-L15]|nr:4-hydroxythreonine-4-phosphate dehydrogenase PdxA [Candidatus Marinamargulisbacteria bacterium SCGC AG-439-L15]